MSSECQCKQAVRKCLVQVGKGALELTVVAAGDAGSVNSGSTEEGVEPLDTGAVGIRSEGAPRRDPYVDTTVLNQRSHRSWGD